MTQHVKTRKYVSRRGIIAHILVKTAQSSFTHFRESVVDLLYKSFSYERRVLSYRSPDGIAGMLPSGRSAAMENVVLSAIWLDAFHVRYFPGK